jgi:hypothetical protein
MKGACFADLAAIQESVTAVLRSIPKEAFADSFQNSVLRRMAIILKANKVNLFVSSVLFIFWYHSPNFLDTPRIIYLRLNECVLLSPPSIASFFGNGFVLWTVC